jgi:predicted enzyme related to lactoylglutathione lyase
MTSGVRTIIYPVSGLDAAKAVFTALLDAEPVMDQPYYVQWDVDGQSIGLDPNGHAQGMTGPVAYWHVDDVAKTVDALVAAGATVQRPARDVGGGTLIATLTDPDGNVIGLRQAA